eukprot:TRINITY_DN23859_c0_g1_i1.p1 TRINITY_DN23859_c0_g1~~TRINITY_DN23859_c0_g1_i1.p1  ORF type:complete len:389 (-),score=53.66 TRINITY_DN23859_c0_g1_i1:96-1262(-)
MTSLFGMVPRLLSSLLTYETVVCLAFPLESFDSRCEKWLSQFEWTTTPDAHSDENYEMFRLCLNQLRSGSPVEGEVVRHRTIAAGIHHPVLLAVHRGTLPHFALQGVKRFDDCHQRAGLPEGSDLVECCNGQRICWDGGDDATKCCAARENKAGDDPPLAFLTAALDVHLGSRLRATKSFNVQESWALQSLVDEGAWVVDAGANIGAYTVPLAHRVGAAGRVYAFEPFRLLYQLLTANVALNGLSNVYTFQVALGDVATSVRLRSPDLSNLNLLSSFQVGTPGYSEQARQWSMRYTDSEEEIEVSPLDSYASKLRRLDLIKIDVEDMEESVVIGAQQLIAAYRPKLWVENAKLFESGDQAFIKRIREMGYACALYPGMEWELLCLPQD